jgi:Lon protease-like protein
MNLPIFPLNTVLFPGIPLPLRVFEERYLRMLAERATFDPVFGIALIATGNEVGDTPTFHRIGTTARLVSLNAQSSHRVDVVVVGDRRIDLAAPSWSHGYAMAETEFLPDRAFDTREGGRLLDRARETYTTWIRAVARLVGREIEVPDIGRDPVSASYDLASRLPMHTWDQQAFLEDDDPASRMRNVCARLERELALLARGGVAGTPLHTPGNRFSLN